MSCHTTILEILDTLILSLVLVPKEIQANTSRPFLVILSAMEVQSLRFLWSSHYKQVLFLSNYNTQNLNPTHTFLYSKKSSNLGFFHHQKNMPSLPQPTSNILFITSSPCFPEIILPISLQKHDPQSSWRIFIEQLRLCSISETNSPSSFIITFKATKHTKNKNPSKVKFFSAIETLHR